MDKKVKVELNYYDVLIAEEFKVIPLILAMSKVDAMHIVELRGYTPLDADISLNDVNIYK